MSIPMMVKLTNADPTGSGLPVHVCCSLIAAAAETHNHTEIVLHSGVTLHVKETYEEIDRLTCEAEEKERGLLRAAFSCGDPNCDSCGCGVDGAVDVTSCDEITGMDPKFFDPEHPGHSEFDPEDN